MADTRTAEQRRYIMQSVRSKDTGPEIIVRRVAHALGYRFRLHRRDLPGTPDLVFPSRKKAVYVHGCFWHGHGCSKGRLPKSRPEFWIPKIERNKERDSEAIAAMEAMGWETLTLWQCATKDRDAVAKALVDFLGPPGAGGSGSR